MISAGFGLLDLLRTVSDAATGSLVAAVWQGALLVAAAATGLRLLKNASAAARFAIWFAVFVLVAGLPALALLGRSGVGVGGSAQAPWLTVSSRWSESILVVWAAASLARAVALVRAAFRVNALWRRATPLPEEQWPEGAVRSAGRAVQICTSDEVDRPSVIGFFAPRILIPSWLVQKLSPDEMGQVILHEAGHLRRADDWLNLLQKVAVVIFPLNPALLWVERRLCFERELACDERVLRVTGAPKAYASCLASLAEHRLGRRASALMMGALGRESELGQRVRRILSRSEGMGRIQTRLVTGGAVLALVAGTAALERTPQLIGFSADTSARETATAMPGVTGRRSGGAYQAVVFHPDSSRADTLRDGGEQRVGLASGVARGSASSEMMGRRNKAIAGIAACQRSAAAPDRAAGESC